jgi:hypothetical protein
MTSRTYGFWRCKLSTKLPIPRLHNLRSSHEPLLVHHVFNRNIFQYDFRPISSPYYLCTLIYMKRDFLLPSYAYIFARFYPLGLFSILISPLNFPYFEMFLLKMRRTIVYIYNVTFAAASVHTACLFFIIYTLGRTHPYK